MPRSTKEEALATRDRILDAAATVFHQNGVARTSLADVAAEASVTRGAVYWHFKNKADLFDAMCERVRLPMEEMAAAGTSLHEADPLGVLRASTLFGLKQATSNPHSRKVFAILFHKCEYVDESDPAYARQQDAMRLSRQRVQGILARAVNKGQLPEDLDIALACTAYQSNIGGLLNNWLFLPRSFDLAGDAERLVDGCIEMLRCAPSLRQR